LGSTTSIENGASSVTTTAKPILDPGPERRVVLAGNQLDGMLEEGRHVLLGIGGLPSKVASEPAIGASGAELNRIGYVASAAAIGSASRLTPRVAPRRRPARRR